MTCTVSTGKDSRGGKGKPEILHFVVVYTGFSNRSACSLGMQEGVDQFTKDIKAIFMQSIGPLTCFM